MRCTLEEDGPARMIDPRGSKQAFINVLPLRVSGVYTFGSVLVSVSIPLPHTMLEKCDFLIT
jgi:hypothetical protein